MFLINHKYLQVWWATSNLSDLPISVAEQANLNIALSETSKTSFVVMQPIYDEKPQIFLIYHKYLHIWWNTSNVPN